MATTNSAAAQERVLPLPDDSPGESAPATFVETGRRPSRGNAWLLTGMVLVLAFLAGSSVVRNSDFWFHLATGRLLARGEYHFGQDPFAQTTAGVYWANHTWLFDLGLYRLHALVGGAGLVVLKALGLTALAALMMRISSRDVQGTAWVPPACCALAILAMSPRLLLQPTCVSFFLLGLTFWLLWEEGRWRLWLLPAVCALWVNLDSWFLLGPLLIALFYLGQRLGIVFGVWCLVFGTKHQTPNTKHQTDPADERQRLPAWVVGASLAACLLSPHHYHAFTLPGELVPVFASTGLRQDVRFQRLFASPWQFGFLWPGGRISLAGLAWFMLVGLCLLSFALNRRAFSAWRLLVWLVFGLLSAAQERLVPFFAVVAGPITALNLQDFIFRKSEVRRMKDEGRQKRRGLSSFILHPSSFILLFVLALVVLAWPGWLHGLGQPGRRVAWGVQPDSSLQRVAQTLNDLRRQGKLGSDDVGFLFHPDVAHYCAWFCPEVKGFIDHRFDLFGARTVRDYEEVCRALNPGLAANSDPDLNSPDGWQTILRERGVTFLVLYDPDLARLFPALRRVAVNPARWSLLSIDGKALVVGWNEAPPRTGPAFTGLRLDTDRLAFGQQGEQERAVLPAAPATGPRGAGPPAPASFLTSLWSCFVRPPTPPAWEADAGAVYLRYQEDTWPAATAHRQAVAGAWRVASMTAHLALSSGAAPASACLVVLRFGDRQVAAEPLLAVRAARLALAANPDDPRAHALLGRAYQILGTMGGEGGLPPLAMLRHIQIATALEQALMIEPDLEAAHATLAQMYRERNYLDLALHHFREQLRLARRAVPRGGEDEDDLRRRLRPLELMVEELDKQVQEARNRFAVGAPSLDTDPLDRARMALGLGLARVALDDALLKSHVLLFGTAGAQLEIELLLMTGRAEEARAKLDDEELKASRAVLGVYLLPGGPLPYELPAYDWLRACQAAATGDYDILAEAMGDLLAYMETRLARDRRQVCLAVTDEVAQRCQGSPWILHVVAQHRRRGLLAQLERDTLATADLHALAGVLALERGQPSVAEAEFRAALRPGVEQFELSCPGRPVAFAYLQRIREQAARHRAIAQRLSSQQR